MLASASPGQNDCHGLFELLGIRSIGDVKSLQVDEAYSAIYDAQGPADHMLGSMDL